MGCLYRRKHGKWPTVMPAPEEVKPEVPDSVLNNVKKKIISTEGTLTYIDGEIKLPEDMTAQQFVDRMLKSEPDPQNPSPAVMADLFLLWQEGLIARPACYPKTKIEKAKEKRLKK